MQTEKNREMIFAAKEEKRKQMKEQTNIRRERDQLKQLRSYE